MMINDVNLWVNSKFNRGVILYAPTNNAEHTHLLNSPPSFIFLKSFCYAHPQYYPNCPRKKPWSFSSCFPSSTIFKKLSKGSVEVLLSSSWSFSLQRTAMHNASSSSQNAQTRWGILLLFLFLLVHRFIIFTFLLGLFGCMVNWKYSEVKHQIKGESNIRRYDGVLFLII